MTVSGRAIFNLQTGEPICALPIVSRFDEARDAEACPVDHITDCDCAGCTRLDGDVIGLSLVRAGKWLGASRLREIRTEDGDQTERRVMTETLVAAARSIGENSPEQIARIRGASLDLLRSAYDALPDPEERTDTMTDIEATARANMQRDAHLAWTKPLNGGRPGDTEPREATDEERTRMDAAERRINHRIAEEFAFQNRVESSVRTDELEDIDIDQDEKERKRRTTTAASGQPTYVAQPNEDDEAKARRRAQRRAQNAWRRPLNKADAQQLEMIELANEEA